MQPLNTLYHVIISVSDFERSIAFYRDTLGFTVVWEKRQFRLTPASDLISAGRVKRDDDLVTGQVELVEFIEPKYKQVPPRGYTDLGYWAMVFEVSDMAKICNEWKSRGVIFEREPETQLVGTRTLHSALIQDIDGNRIELVQEG